MLDQNDLKKIGEEFGRVIEDNINPQFNALGGRMDKLETRMDNLEKTVDNLGKTVANLPNKSYIDDKFADLEGSTIARQRKGDEKVNRLIAFLATNRALNDQQVAELKQFQIFPAPPKA